MDQHSTALVPLPEGLEVASIHHELEAVFGPNVMPYSTLTHTLRSVI
jgi:hypothetical protein